MFKKQFFTADDVAEIMQVSKPKAYEIIRELNGQMEKMGFMTVRGRINSTFFYPYLFIKAVNLLPRLQLKPLISCVYDLEQGIEAFEANRDKENIKVLIKSN